MKACHQVVCISMVQVVIIINILLPILASHVQYTQYKVHWTTRILVSQLTVFTTQTFFFSQVITTPTLRLPLKPTVNLDLIPEQRWQTSRPPKVSRLLAETCFRRTPPARAICCESFTLYPVNKKFLCNLVLLALNGLHHEYGYDFFDFGVDYRLVDFEFRKESVILYIISNRCPIIELSN